MGTESQRDPPALVPFGLGRRADANEAACRQKHGAVVEKWGTEVCFKAGFVEGQSFEKYDEIFDGYIYSKNEPDGFPVRYRELRGFE